MPLDFESPHPKPKPLGNVGVEGKRDEKQKAKYCKSTIIKKFFFLKKPNAQTQVQSKTQPEAFPSWLSGNESD